MKKYARIAAGMLGIVTVAAVMTGCAYKAPTSSKPSSSAAGQTAGGDLTVVTTGGLGTMTSLDPIAPANPNSDPKNAIFGELIHVGENQKIEPALAASESVSSDGLTITFKLHSGLTFSDGTPLDAQAVKTAWDRDLDPKNACGCLATYNSVASTTATDATTFTVSLKKPMPAFLPSLSGTALNWITDPKQDPSQYATQPIGAGPFKVQSFDANQKLVLAKNSTSYDKPYLDTLTFQSIGSDQSAYAAIQSGEAQIVEGITTPPIFTQAKQQYDVVSSHSTSVWMNQFNTISGPMANIKARQALIYATDPAAINKAVFDGQNKVAQMGIAPGLPFYQETVSGTLGYNLSKAKQLIQDLGGLKVEIMETTSSVGQQVAQALQAEWTAAGVTVTLDAPSLAQKQAKIKAGSWDVDTAYGGSADPTGTLGVNSFFGSHQPNSGVADPQLDALIQAAATEMDKTKRADDYKQVWQRITDQADAGFLFSNETYNIVAKTGVVNADQPVRWIDWGKVSTK